jgi:hypothetical protein
MLRSRKLYGQGSLKARQGKATVFALSMHAGSTHCLTLGATWCHALGTTLACVLATVAKLAKRWLAKCWPLRGG